jgi:thymidylate synthase (FAD)
MQFTSDITVILKDHMGSDARVAEAARVSTQGDAALNPNVVVALSAIIDDPDHPYGLKALRALLGYLMKHRHGSPFEHGALTFIVHAPIFVWREWHRHRIGFAYADYGLDADTSMSFNEESGRYKKLDPVFYIAPPMRPMYKVENWKPGRPKFLTREQYDLVLQEQYHTGIAVSHNSNIPLIQPGDFSTPISFIEDIDRRYHSWLDRYRSSCIEAYDTYEQGLELGLDPGLARASLPVSTFSTCYVTCNPRSLMAFLSLRTHEPEASFVSYPLYEIEVAARICEDLFAQYWPITYEAFCKNGRVAP